MRPIKFLKTKFHTFIALIVVKNMAKVFELTTAVGLREKQKLKIIAILMAWKYQGKGKLL